MRCNRNSLLLLVSLFLTSSIYGAERPNFVWLMSEDNSVHYLRLYADRGAKTPNIEALAKEGLVFDHAFSNGAVCSVARTTLITGCYAPRLGTQFHRHSAPVNLPEGLRMFPAYLRDAGYYTTNKRKKDYNAIEDDDVWDVSSGKAHWRNRKTGQPFFHKQTFTVSHEGSLHFSKLEMQQQPTQTDTNDVAIAPYHPDTPTFRYTVARYLDRMVDADRQIGQVVDDLEKDGLLDDTFIFYFGDHGGVLPRGKGYAYESGLHVPLVVRVPKNFRHLVLFKSDSRVPGFVSFVDFGPTLLNLAGIESPEQMDGQPFLGPNIEADEVNQRDEAFGYADRFDEKYDLVRTLRKGRFEYIRHFQPFNFDGLQNNYRYRMLAYRQWRELYRDGKLNNIQRQFFETRPVEALYDIENDPHETRNLAEDPNYQQQLVDMRQRLSQRLRRMPDLSFFPESVLVKEAVQDPVAFGKKYHTEIERLIEIADLSLLPFSKAEPLLRKALKADSPWERYWGVIAASCHGDDAKSLAEEIHSIAKDDPESLVRMRAAEFMGLTNLTDPAPILKDILNHTTDPVETLLILNTVALLRDGKPGYPIHIDRDSVRVVSKEIERRLDYFDKTKETLAK